MAVMVYNVLNTVQIYEKFRFLRKMKINLLTIC
jgi:hypothetical protein